jgi:hypothetical protein
MNLARSLGGLMKSTDYQSVEVIDIDKIIGILEVMGIFSENFDIHRWFLKMFEQQNLLCIVLPNIVSPGNQFIHQQVLLSIRSSNNLQQLY